VSPPGEEERGSEVRTNADLTAAAGHGLRWVTYARIVIEVTLLASMVVLARLIPPAQFGMFAIVLIVQELALALPMEGVGSALVQRHAIGRAHLQAGLFLSLAVGVTLAGLTLLAADLVVAPVYGHETASLVRLAMPWFVIGAVYSVPAAVLRRNLDFTHVNLTQLAMTLTRAMASIGFALAGLDATALVLGNLFGMLAALVLALIFAPVPLPRWNPRAMRDLLPYGGPAALACVAWTGFRNGDYAIIGARLGAVQAGFYYRAYQLAVEYQKKVSAVIAQMAFPVLARTAGPEAMADLRHRIVQLLSVMLYPMLALLALLAPVVIPWLFGPAWEPAVTPTRVLAIGGAATLTIDAIGSALQASGRASALLGYGVAHFAVYVGVVIVVSGHGIVAVSAGAGIVHTAFLIVAYKLLLRGQRRSALRVLWHDVGPAIVCCAALVATAGPAQWALGQAHAGPFFTCLLVGATAAAAYLAALRILFRAAWRDLASAMRRVLPARFGGRRTPGVLVGSPAR
jgi:lipopolysaccharide exporter